MQLSREEVKKLPKSKLLGLINQVKEKIKTHPTVVKMFKEYGIDPSEIDLYPMCFAELDVSARTEKGVIYFNYALLEDGNFEGDDHYMVHELSHVLQQTGSTHPTKGSTDDTYLDNKYEQEGFQNQTEYLSETRGDQAAENYVEQVLDHHEVDNPKERMEKRKELLGEAGLDYNLLKLAGRWSSIIRGEWWLTKDGDAIYADQDVGEVGHEIIAADMLLDKDVLLEGLKEYYAKEFQDGKIEETELQELSNALEEYEGDDVTAGNMFFNLTIPDSVGAEAAGSNEIWQEMKKDVRTAYAKHHGAILAINTNFYAWAVSDETIKAIQDFILEEMSQSDTLPTDEEILVEEAKTKKHVSMPLDEFLNIKHVGELWRQHF